MEKGATNKMWMKRRCCRKVPIFNDSFAVVILAVCLLVGAIYYISPFGDQPNTKSDLTQKHLREIVKLDQQKKQLSLQIDEYDDE